MHASLTTAIVLLLAVVAHAAPEAVTTCGQVIQDRSAALTADLDCSSFAGDAVVLPHGGRLTLNGFTLTGATDLVPGGTDYALILCRRSCRVNGPGTLSGGWNGARLQPLEPFSGDGRLNINGVLVSGAGIGVNAKSLRVGGGSVLTGNAIGASGIQAVVGGGTTITANRDVGVAANRVSLRSGSTVTGNGGVDCQVSYCSDLFTSEAPRVGGGASCGTSLHNNTGEPWGVCTND